MDFLNEIGPHSKDSRAVQLLRAVKTGTGTDIFPQLFTAEAHCYFGEFYTIMTRFSSQRISSVTQAKVNQSISNAVTWINTDYILLVNKRFPRVAGLQGLHRQFQSLRETKKFLQHSNYCEVSLGCYLTVCSILLLISQEIGRTKLRDTRQVLRHIEEMGLSIHGILRYITNVCAKVVARHKDFTLLSAGFTITNDNQVELVRVQWVDNTTGSLYLQMCTAGEKKKSWDRGTEEEMLVKAKEAAHEAVEEKILNVTEEVLMDINKASRILRAIRMDPLPGLL